jgi:hypothetical protein
MITPLAIVSCVFYFASIALLIVLFKRWEDRH